MHPEVQIHYFEIQIAEALAATKNCLPQVVVM
jgi:hypothetical protein